jgi:hypothetical protein
MTVAVSIALATPVPAIALVSVVISTSIPPTVRGASRAFSRVSPLSFNIVFFSAVLFLWRRRWRSIWISVGHDRKWITPLIRVISFSMNPGVRRSLNMLLLPFDEFHDHKESVERRLLFSFWAECKNRLQFRNFAKKCSSIWLTANISFELDMLLDSFVIVGSKESSIYNVFQTF